MKDNKKYGAYQYGVEKAKKKSSKAVTIVIVVVLLLSLSAGAAGIYREDIKGLFNKSEPVTPVDPDPTTPVIPDEPVTPVDPDPTTPVIPDEPETPVNPEPSIVRLSAGGSPDSIYIDTDNFESSVKSHIADLDIDQSPDYMGIGYKFLSVPVVYGENDTEFQFVIVPFARLFDNLGIEILPDGISEDDFFLLIYSPDLNDWAFDDCYYSSVTADLAFGEGEESINLSFVEGFRKSGISFDDGQVDLEALVKRTVFNRLGISAIYNMDTINYVDTLITPIAFAAEPLSINAVERNLNGDLYFTFAEDLAVRTDLLYQEGNLSDCLSIVDLESGSYNIFLDGVVVAFVDFNYINDESDETFVHCLPIILTKVSDLYARMRIEDHTLADSLLLTCPLDSYNQPLNDNATAIPDNAYVISIGYTIVYWSVLPCFTSVIDENNITSTHFVQNIQPYYYTDNEVGFDNFVSIDGKLSSMVAGIPSLLFESFTISNIICESIFGLLIEVR